MDTSLLLNSLAAALLPIFFALEITSNFQAALQDLCHFVKLTISLFKSQAQARCT